MAFVFQMARVKYIIKKQSTLREETKKRRAKFPSITQDKMKKRYKAARKRTAARRAMRRNSKIMATMESEVVAEITPEIQLELVSTTATVETQAQPPQMSPREELAARLHSMGRNMPTAADFLTGWSTVIVGEQAPPILINAVSSITVMSSTMHQLIMNPGVQIAMIPVSIPLDASKPLWEGPINYQSHLWMEGHVPGEEEGESQERIVELELDKEVETQSEGHDGNQEGTWGGEPTDTVEESARGTPDYEPMETSEGKVRNHWNQREGMTPI